MLILYSKGDNYPILNENDTAVDKLLGNPKARKILHFEDGNAQWLSCIPGAGRRRRRRKLEQDLLPGQILLAHDKPEATTPYIAELLDDAGIRVLMYAGDRDLAVNLQGSELVLNGMAWSGADDWIGSDRYLWMVDGDVGGYVKTHKNLDMLLVQDSGHLVPYNNPIPALDMINRLVNDQPYGDIKLPKIEFADDDEEEEFKVQGPNHYSTLISVLVAFLCFVAGTIVGSRWNSQSVQYEKIP